MVEGEVGEGVVVVAVVVQVPAAAPCPGATIVRGPPCLSIRESSLMSCSSLRP